MLKLICYKICFTLYGDWHKWIKKQYSILKNQLSKEFVCLPIWQAILLLRDTLGAGRQFLFHFQNKFKKINKNDRKLTHLFVVFIISKQMSFTYLANQIFPPGAQIGNTICTNDKKGQQLCPMTLDREIQYNCQWSTITIQCGMQH
jgi:hypothetical protein